MKMTGFAAATLLAGAAFAFPAPSQAQVLGDIFGSRDARASRDDASGYRDTYRTGYDRGFEDGSKRSEKDRSKGDDYGLIHDSKYRKGDAGYKKSYGPRQDYIAGYRDGYEQAYRRGYRTGDARGRDHGRGAYGRTTERDDPYGYGRDGRYGRDDRTGRDDRYGTDPYERDDPYGDQGYGRDDRDRRDRDDDYDDDVVYEEPPGRW
jgi:hypothetical protein